MENLVKGVDGLGKGSRILITSRDRHVLQNCHVNDDNIYEVEGFNPHEALQLFHSYAFKDSHPIEDFTVLSEEFVNYAKGNPLALKVLGSSLYQKSKQEWESAVNILQTNLDRKIFDMLKISFDGLEYREKNIFLDIACFLKGKTRDYVAKILDDCDYSLSVLISKSLITISWDNSIQMHDLLQEMGRKIVHNESPSELGKRSRLWRQKDVLDTLKRDDGTNAVQGIVLDMSKIKDMHLSPQAFKKMYNLRLLQLYDSTSCIEMPYLEYTDSLSPYYHSKVHFKEGLCDLSDKLGSLIWVGYPLLALPSNFNPENLIELDLSSSNIETLWEDTMHAPKLKRLHLSQCTRLQHIPTSIWKLKSLYELNLENCSRLESFPEILDTMECLETLNLSGTAIQELPENLGDLKSLTYLSADRTAISQLPSSMKHLKNLQYLSCCGCRGLRFTHSSGLPCSLRSLCLSDCNLREIPEDICRLSSLFHLNLSENHFEHLPKSMKQLCDLEELILYNCNMLQSLTELPSRIYHLNATDCKQLRSIPDVSEIAEMIRYEFAVEFIFTNCLNLEAAVGNMVAQLRKYLNKESHCYGFCYSGSEVPGWFIYRTEGSSIKFEWHGIYSDQLLGFAVCAVIAFEKYCSNGSLRVRRRILSNNKVWDWGDSMVTYTNRTLIDSDHVFFMFLPSSLWKLPSEFTIEFSLLEESPNCRVKYCGVCPIYASQNIGETSGSCTSDDHQEEEVEPHSKRLKP